jgi:hypothetical protein
MDTVKFCEANITDARLLGFLQTFWAPTTEDNRKNIFKAIELLGEAKRWYIKNHQN